MATIKISEWNEVTEWWQATEKYPGMGFINAIVYKTHCTFD